MVPALSTNLYVNNLSEMLPPKVNSHQYVDDTTVYKPLQTNRAREWTIGNASCT
jgi:hypothetical protein